MKCIFVLFVFFIFTICTTIVNGNVQVYIDNDEYVCSKLDGNDEIQGQNSKTKCNPSKATEFKLLKQELEGEGYTYYNNFGFYKIHSRRVDWLTAKMICESERTHLVVVNSKEEINLVHNLYKALPSAAFTHSTQCFIGINDRNREGYWEAETGGTAESSGYSTWSPGNPSGGRTENCGTINSLNLYLNDFPCDYPIYFMCEKECHY